MIAHSPANVDEASAVMALTYREKQRVTFIGGGTQQQLGNPPADVDAEIRTARMNRILEYAPADMVMRVEAGATLAQVQAAAREHRQMLALDPPNPDRSTIGGMVATGAYGPRRARFGAVRDLIIGVTLVRGDGVVARGGGKVVKNVAGFDLPKVACGSLGTLGMIADATFRLHPLPESSETVVFERLTPEDVVSLVASVRQAQLEPTSAVALRTNHGTYDLVIRFEGFAKGVEQQTSGVRRLAAGLRMSESGGKPQHSLDEARTNGALRIKLGTLPTRLPAVDAVLEPLLAALDRSSFAWYATLGLGFASGNASDMRAVVAALQAARSALVETGGWLVIDAAPAEVRREVDAWGPKPGAFAIMEQLKLRFDPERRLNPGRFVGGL
ncbi:MAG TPA: FAD-binding oxidoreductase [Thermoanaerobaculia bacterium]